MASHRHGLCEGPRVEEDPGVPLARDWGGGAAGAGRSGVADSRVNGKHGEFAQGMYALRLVDEGDRFDKRKDRICIAIEREELGGSVHAAAAQRDAPMFSAACITEPLNGRPPKTIRRKRLASSLASANTAVVVRSESRPVAGP